MNLNPKDWIDLLLRLFTWINDRRNPVRQQAARILETFEAHDVARTQINALLPAALHLPAYQWSSADQLKLVLRQEHIDWLNQHFVLHQDWLAVRGESAHVYLFSYKSPELLHQWLQDNRRPEGGLEFRLFLVTPDSREIGPDSQGYYALVLEQIAEDLLACRRFYHLTEGAHFEHGPSLVHLLQVLAIAHYHGVILQRAQMDAVSLYQLSHHQGLIPNWLDRCRPHPLAADHELWQHFSGHSPWLNQLRADAEQGLRRASLAEVVERLHFDTLRFSRQPSGDSAIAPSRIEQ